MSIKFKLILMLYLLRTMLCKKRDDQPILLKLNTDQIVDTVKAVISSHFIKEIADEMASKTAQHIIEEMKNQNNGFSYGGNYERLRKVKK